MIEDFRQQIAIWQSEPWENFQAALGHKTFRVGRILLVKTVLPFGRSFFTMARGNLSAADFQHIAQLARQEKAIFLRWAPNESTLPKWLAPGKFVATGAFRFPTLTGVVDLRQGEEKIREQMSQTGRRHLRVAERSGIEICPSGICQNEKSGICPSESVDSFFKLLQETTCRKGFASHGKKYFAKLLQSFGRDAMLLLAKKDGVILAGGIFVLVGKVCTYFFGASRPDLQKLQAPTLLQFEAMRRAIAREAAFFDFLGIAPKDTKGHKWAGVSQFKRKFGGQEIDFAGEVEIPFAPLWHLAFRAAKAGRKALHL